jgi:hypothetical protein
MRVSSRVNFGALLVKLRRAATSSARNHVTEYVWGAAKRVRGRGGTQQGQGRGPPNSNVHLARSCL